MIRSIFKISNLGVLLLISLLSLLPSCTQEEEVVAIPPDKMGVVDLIIGTPFSDQPSRMPGDPGLANPEGEDWDQMVLMVVYENPPEYGDRFLTKVLSKKAFEDLPKVDNSSYRKLSWKMPKGRVYVYGCTYSNNVQGAPQFNIDKNKSCDEIKKEIESLTISNDYAKDSKESIAKFLSVATGFYDKPDFNNATDGKPDPLIVKSGGQDVGERFTMRLGRLATKLDVQWDAQDAYENINQQVKEVRVPRISIVPSEGSPVPDANADKGSGRLFPSLVKPADGVLLKGASFYNNSSVSQRNGRFYHYIFPDGVCKPIIKYDIKGTVIKDDKEDLVEISPSITLSDEALQAGAWYKVNTLIKGLKPNTQITVKNAN